MPETGPKKAFSVNFTDLDRWNVAYFRSINWQWPKKYIRPIGEVISRVQVLVNSNSEDTPIIEKISFGGKLSILERDKRTGYKGRLFKAKSGQLIYSKIRVKQGSVCVIPPAVNLVAVSSEYPIYEINQEIANATYLDLVLRSSAFKHYLEGLSHGGSTKTRIHPKLFETLSIPIPPLPVQQKIVTYWTNALSHQQRLLVKRAEIKSEYQSLILNSLGIKISAPKSIGKLFCLNWANSERWSYEFNKRVLSGLAEVRTGQYQTTTLGKLCRGQSGSTPSKDVLSFWRNGNVPWVSPKDMKAREIRDSIDHITAKAIEDHQAPMVPEGSILFVVRSGILQKMVPVAVTRERVSINQDLRGFTPRSGNVLPDFLLAYFEAKQEDLLQLVKWSTTVQSINKEELESFPVPLPPIEIQKKIVASANEFQSEINNCDVEYQRSISSTRLSIEQMIIGIRAVEDI